MLNINHKDKKPIHFTFSVKIERTFFYALFFIIRIRNMNTELLEKFKELCSKRNKSIRGM